MSKRRGSPEPLNLGDPFGEFTAAAMFYNAMIYVPSYSRRIAPMAFKYVYGVTPYPTQNNGPLLSLVQGQRHQLHLDRG